MKKEKTGKSSNTAMIKYYNSKGLANLAENRKVISRVNENKGLTSQKVKIKSSNFDRLMKERGISSNDSKQLKSSFAHWNKDSNPKIKKQHVTVRHAKVNEIFTITNTKGKNASGIFVSKKSLGKDAKERIDRGSLPITNKANNEKKVCLAKPQNVIEGRIAPQKEFQQKDAKNLPRNGGGIQTITDGGYNKGAIKNVEESSKKNAFKSSKTNNKGQRIKTSISRVKGQKH